MEKKAIRQIKNFWASKFILLFCYRYVVEPCCFPLLIFVIFSSEQIGGVTLPLTRSTTLCKEFDPGPADFVVCLLWLIEHLHYFPVFGCMRLQRRHIARFLG